jgi:hypothetical protein
LKGPEGYENTYGVWCECGFRGPVFYLEPEELKLKKKAHNVKIEGQAASGLSRSNAGLCGNITE